MNKEIRAGRFTSSQIYKLVSKGNGYSAPGLTYIKEVALERLFEDNLYAKINSKATCWGKFMEAFLFVEKLGTEYKISSDESKKHPDEHLGKYWAGSCDFEIDNGIAEAKCYYRKNFGLYTLCLLKEDIELLKKEFPQEYWQIVSNAIIHGVEYGEAISFMPYKSDIEKAKEYAEDAIWVQQYLKEPIWNFRFIYEDEAEDLPTLNDNGYFEDVNKFRFLIPKEDRDLLINRIEGAIEIIEEITF